MKIKIFGYELAEIRKAIVAAIGTLATVLTLTLGPDNKWTVLVGVILATLTSGGVALVENAVKDKGLSQEVQERFYGTPSDRYEHRTGPSSKDAP